MTKIAIGIAHEADGTKPLLQGHLRISDAHRRSDGELEILPKKFLVHLDGSTVPTIELDAGNLKVVEEFLDGSDPTQLRVFEVPAPVLEDGEETPATYSSLEWLDPGSLEPYSDAKPWAAMLQEEAAAREQLAQEVAEKAPASALEAKANLVDGVVPQEELPTHLAPAELNSTYVALGKASMSVWPGGRSIMFVGDSITNGSSGSNSAKFFTTRVRVHAGREIVDSNRQGFPGERADQIAARLPGLIATNAPAAVHLQAGTNDAGQGRTVAQFLAALDVAKAACDNAGIPLTVGTVPPRSSSFADHTLITAYNLALRTWAGRHGVDIVDTHSALVDTETGYLATAYDAGDGVHPNDAGHEALAVALAAFFVARARRLPWLVMTKEPGNLIPNPINDPDLAGWSAAAGSGPVSSFVDADGADDLTAGRWRRTVYTNAGGSTVNYSYGQQIDMTGVEAGDVLRLVLKYEADVTSTAVMHIQLSRGSGVASRPVDGATSTPASGVIFDYTVQSADIGPTMRWGASLSIPVGATLDVRLGQLGVFNLTKLGAT